MKLFKNKELKKKPTSARDCFGDKLEVGDSVTTGYIGSMGIDHIFVIRSINRGFECYVDGRWYDPRSLKLYQKMTERGLEK